MILAPLLLIATFAAQAPAAPATEMPHRFNRVFISPMGEPFRPNGRDDDTLADWFHQADLNHDGFLSVDEMQKDAERFFAMLDLNHDGEIDPDEISHYETAVAPEISTAHLGFASMGGSNAGEHGGWSRGGGRRAGGRGRGRGWSDDGADDAHQGGARYGLLDLPEPVSSADSDFNRGVSLAEFRQAATQRFVALDVDHQGQLSLSVLETLKPPPPAKGNKPKRPTDVDESALPDDPGL